jgi:hypothetical protein
MRLSGLPPDFCTHDKLPFTYAQRTCTCAGNAFECPRVPQPMCGCDGFSCCQADDPGCTRVLPEHERALGRMSRAQQEQQANAAPELHQLKSGE